MIGGFSQGGAVALALALGTGRPAGGRRAGDELLPADGAGLAARHPREGAECPPSSATAPSTTSSPSGFGRRVNDVLTEEGPLSVTYRETRVLHSIDPELLPEMTQWVSAVTGGPDPIGDGPQLADLDQPQTGRLGLRRAG